MNQTPSEEMGGKYETIRGYLLGVPQPTRHVPPGGGWRGPCSQVTGAGVLQKEPWTMGGHAPMP